MGLCHPPTLFCIIYPVPCIHNIGEKAYHPLDLADCISLSSFCGIK